MRGKSEEEGREGGRRVEKECKRCIFPLTLTATILPCVSRYIVYSVARVSKTRIITCWVENLWLCKAVFFSQETEFDDYRGPLSNHRPMMLDLWHVLCPHHLLKSQKHKSVHQSDQTPASTHCITNTWGWYMYNAREKREGGNGWWGKGGLGLQFAGVWLGCGSKPEHLEKDLVVVRRSAGEVKIVPGFLELRVRSFINSAIWKTVSAWHTNGRSQVTYSVWSVQYIQQCSRGWHCWAFCDKFVKQFRFVFSNGMLDQFFKSQSVHLQ